MKKLLPIVLSTCLLTSTVPAQRFDALNYRAIFLRAVATRANLLKVDSTGAVFIGNTTSTEVQKGLELLLEFPFEACIEYTN